MNDTNPRPIQVSEDKVTTVAQWRGRGVSWRTAIRRPIMQPGAMPVFVLRACGHGTLFYRVAEAMRQRTWRQVRVVPALAVPAVNMMGELDGALVHEKP